VIRFTLLFFFLLITFLSSGQNLELISRIKGDLKNAEKEKRFALLNKLAWEYRWAYPDSTIFYASEAYILGQNLKLKKGIAEPLNFIGVAYNYKGDRINAYDYYEKALSISTNQKDSIQIAYSDNNLGRLFFEQGVLSRSYDYFARALRIFESLRNPSGIAYSYQSLANLYKSQNDFEKAENHYKKAYELRLAIGNTRDIMSALSQIGMLYQDNHDQDKALHYLHKADSAGRIINDEINLAEIKTQIANSYLNQNRLDQAEAMCAEGLTVISKGKNLRLLPQAYLTMGQIQLRKKQTQPAKKYFNQALSISTEIKDLNSTMESYYWLWQISKLEQNKSQELSNHNQYLVLRDSVKDLDVTRQVERLQFEIEISRKEQENELLKANQAKNDALIQQQKLQNIILIIVLVSISMLVLFQWMSIKKRKDIYEKLREQNTFIQRQRQEIIEQNEKLSIRNQELSDLNYEKDTLMSIVAHDLKSPLNRINGIVQIMELEGGLTTDQRSYLRMIKEGTHAGLDLIKDLLDVHMLQENTVPHFEVFDLSTFILEKTKAFELAAGSKGIHLQITRVESEDINMDVAYLGRIVDNLLSNAIKFSVPDSEVQIGAGRDKDHFWISVKDNGPGFNEKDRNLLFQRFKKLSARPTAGESSNGLGLAIVKTLVDRLHGTIELISEPKKGSEFIVRLPLVPVLKEAIVS
jgi:signal transduction histidine kinase/Tfp pilus assembly protein PilF